MKETVEKTLKTGILKKIVYSVARPGAAPRVTAKPYMGEEGKMVQFETLLPDGKVAHKNVPAAEAPEYANALFTNDYSRANVLTTAGEFMIMRSRKGKVSRVDRIKYGAAPEAEIGSHDADRNYVIPEGTPCEFLRRLGVCDEKGRVFDRRRAKFRQINRFLEIVRDVFPDKPEKELYVLDLCCGKSYLTFALYHYLTGILGARVRMIGVDLKKDVVDYCAAVAADCGFDGLSFIAGDITAFTPERAPDLVVSLHACDTATDVVLATAVRCGAARILSSPCCQHEMARQLPHDDGDLGFILSRPLFRDRFAVLATDALRTLMLEARGYRVDAVEFIDPEETPKNLMIRAVRTGKDSPAALERYRDACRRFGIAPKLAVLLGEIDDQ